jgi:hypothetical protein
VVPEDKTLSYILVALESRLRQALLCIFDRRRDHSLCIGNDTEKVIGICIMNAQFIKTDAEHAAVLKRIEDIFDAMPGTPEGDECERLVHLVEAYEAQHHTMDLPESIEAIKRVTE